MTLIAAFRCQVGEYPGVIICADTQETVGDYRVAVDKIQPGVAGYYDLVIGGAGNVAALIDGLTDAIKRNVQRWDADLDEEAARLRIERVLLTYHARQVAFYPAEADEKRLRFVICIRDKNTGNIHLWKTDGTAIEAVTTYTILGWEEAIYDYEVRRFYRPGLWFPQAVYLGLQLFSTAKATSNYVGGDTQVITASHYGMDIEEQVVISELEQYAATFNVALAELVRACPDTSIFKPEFQTILANFEKQAERLRLRYLQRSFAYYERVDASRDAE